MSDGLERAFEKISERRDEFQSDIASVGNALDAYDECLDILVGVWAEEIASGALKSLFEMIGLPRNIGYEVDEILKPLYEDAWLKYCELIRDARNDA